MWDDSDCNCDFHGYEEEYRDYYIEIERNPDPYRGGYIWSVGDESEVQGSDLLFSLNDCLKAARKLADELTINQQPTY
jgi:hypothetical protein